MDIQLNFINNSNDQSNSEVVIFQKNVATGYEALPVAWTVIRNCGIGENHPFNYPATMQVAVGDSDGNYSPKLEAQPGQQFAATLTGSGNDIMLKGAASHPTDVQVVNMLSQGAISANIYRDGRRVATKTGVAPGQMAAFAFEPTLWIGVASQVEQGQIMNSAIVDQVKTELSLLGIAGADIVMTGGGPGQNSTPITFSLQKVVTA